MSNGREQQVTKERIDELKDSILEEFQALVAKLPWWKSTLIGLGLVASIISALVGCAAIAGATGPAAVLAYAGCILGAIGAITAIVLYIVEQVGMSGEADEIDRKRTRLEEARTILERQKQAAPG